MEFSKQRNACSLILSGLIAVMIGGCASYTKAIYPKNADPANELAQLEGDLDRGAVQHEDILAPKEFGRAQKHMRYAKVELAKNHMSDFWDEMGIARGYLNRADELTSKRGPKVADVLKTRQRAIEFGARLFPETKRELSALDDSFKKNSKSLDYKGFDKKAWQQAIIDYSALRIRAIRETHVGQAQDMIREAKRKNARYYAPRALDQAESALRRAEKAIAEHPDDVSAFKGLADRANLTARQLIALNATARRAAGQSNEEVAREIVGRNRTISNLKSEVEGADLEADITARELRQKEKRLEGLSAANKGLRSEQEWNDALNEARGEFSEDEAEVYRQGDKLLIRLKKMDFPTGSAEVPARAKPLLGKISSLIEELNAKNVEIQGHTDSTGPAQLNKKLSKERADAVAEYLGDEVGDIEMKSVGYGYDRPITQNRNAKGRAMNRRVDVVITPASPSSK
jgi:outer membrane protein OmpA-like peptidoglycan-associated protein